MDRPALARPLAALVICLGVCGCASRTPSPPASAASPRERTLLDSTAPSAAARKSNAGGAAVTSADSTTRPGRLLVYSAITGHTPLGNSPTPSSADRYRTPAEREAARAQSLEAEIEEEMSRQEQLQVEEYAPTPAPSIAPAPNVPPELQQGAHPLLAPAAPETRELPRQLFSTDRITVPAGLWDNPQEIEVVRQTLDADRDGKPEEIRYLEPRSRLLIRAEQDRNFDGTIDTWNTYVNGAIAVRVIDDDGDGKSDEWERYSEGRMNARTIDRNHDGVRDTFYRYEGEYLVEKSEDANDDGTIDRVVVYQNLHRLRSEEDRSLNGWMDTWIVYQVIEGQEVVASVDRDSRDQGDPNVFETYETSDGETRLSRREEDIDGDGDIDVVSIYKNGKLVQRAISDEALAPL
jgi:hypothetical protein